ncbi:MAG: ATP-grasp domain-containing protein, partial [Bacteroidetes bacterium]
MKELNSILIANRGEIASRIMRSCRKMGIRSVAVFSDADRHAPYLEEADSALYLGESAAAASYLNVEKILEAARRAGVDAIHPGYGFLAENAAFARACAAQGFVFIGPRPEAIELMGSKWAARELMQAQEVPVVPGYQGSDQSLSRFEQEAARIGYPVLLKATAGGGGKGMRLVRTAPELEAAMQAARSEAEHAFGNSRLMLEAYIEEGRHIEFQIMGDRHGQLIHLLERECSLQRRYQKVMEESPSPVMNPQLRQRMADAALRAARALQYDNAGTVEFIYQQQTDTFYFLEVNTRLQVEHPVTEAITGLDLVQLQIESAAGMPLRIAQEEVKSRGYALELRLYAEDATRNFQPASGRILHFEAPQLEGLRLESAVRSGSDIPVYYDPMIAKLIIRGETRSEAHRKMRYTLRQLHCLGITTNQDFLLALMNMPAVQ